MSTNSNLLLLSLLLVIIQTVAGQSPASTTLLITGHSSNNLYKYAFAQKFVSQVELDRAHSSDIVVISTNVVDDLRQEDGLLLRTVVGRSHHNFSRVVVVRLGTQEMNLDHIQHLYSYIDTDEPLIVVEIGEQSVQTRALLNKGALCWGEASADILSPNRVYLCNDVSPEIVKKVVDINSIQSLEEGNRVLVIEPARSFWPSLFASAAKTEKQNRRKQAQETIEVEEDDVEEIVDQIMENIGKSQPKHQAKRSEPTDKKLGCKYRKSCYESGKLPGIEDSSLDWFDWDKMAGYFAWGEKKDVDGQDDDDSQADDDDDEENLTPRKLKCKYRLDCYKEKGIKLTGKDGEREERKSILAGKTGPQQGKKKTLKEIAERTVQKVKVAEEKAAARPLSSAMIAERKLNKMEEKLTEKLQCKYRKSCYETGEPPAIAESTWSLPVSLPVFSTHSAEQAVEEVDFQEMEDLERKVFCKYRKSCYETGVKPDIEPEIQIHSFSDLRELPDVIETRKQTIQEKCKYRKSCYETGILPDLNTQIEEEVAQKEVNTVVPTNMEQLKKFCKYRKSCYEEIAQSASVETVANIRKRRVIEKEVRRRKARRARMRRRLRGIELEAGEKKPKNKRYNVQANETEQKPVEEPVEEKRVEEEKQETVASKQPKKKAAKVEEPVEIEKPAKLKKVKKEEVKEPEPEPEETPKHKKKGRKAPEPEPEPELETEKEPEPVVEETPKPKKKGKRAAEPEPEPEPEKEPEPVVKKPKHKKGKKEEPKEEEEVEQKPVIEEPPAVKIVHKEKKQKKEKEPESKEEEETLGYKEKLELQAHCKYRKSCYETKERPVIHQTLASLYDKFDTHVNEHYDRIENAELSPADKKLACKYRKTCYETKKRPIISQTLSTIWAGTAASPEEPRNVHVEGLNQAMKNLRCKYRKSCYETGRLPDVLNPEPVEFEGDLDEPENWHKDEHRKLACKYRNSCYAKHGWHFGHDEEEGEKKEEKPVEVKKKETPKVKEAEKLKPKEHKKKAEVKPVPVVKVEEDDDEEEEEATKEEIKKEEAPEVADEDLPNLERNQKLSCKYRKSCYVNATPSEAPTRTVTIGGVTQRTKCNQYYLSCREKLGLPPKEKAPIGPSGRRLCRKKKTDQ